MEYALREKQGRLILSFPRRIAPVKVAVLPLVDNEKIVGVAKKIYDMLKETDLMVTYDDSGSIGRRYARADEIGVPVCVTIDYQSLVDGTVTLRDRDSWKQVRVHVDKLVESLRRFIYDNVEIEELGPIFFSEEKE
jgi:glycyl-tRNA synthetase